MKLRSILAAAVLALAASPALAGPVGELHRTAQRPDAAMRDAGGSADVRVTIWYPAGEGSREQRLTIGPPGRPLFEVASAAPDASFAGGRAPVLLLSHGFGGTARMMGWFGVAMAREGYVVVAVDHPGNNGADAMTVPGALMFWERPGDLRAALALVAADPVIAPHIDLARVGVAGFSAGGFTALASAGAKVDLPRMVAFCQSHPEDGVCRPQVEFPISAEEQAKAMASPAFAGAEGRAAQDHAIPQVRAAFAMAPAIVQALDPSSLSAMRLPVMIVAGNADTVAPPATNAEVAVRAIPGAVLELLPKVGHYDFLSDCTPAGLEAVPICKVEAPKAGTHQRAIEAAKAFFAHALPGAAQATP
jgi:predicted dienelactone hydrolase